MLPFRIGIDSYCLNPLRWGPFAILEKVAKWGGEGVQFSEVHLPPGRSVDRGLLEELAEEARGKDMYLEWGGGQHVPFDTATWDSKDLTSGNRKAAEEANILGTQVVRSCSGGFFRWGDAAPPTEELLDAMVRALRPQRAFLEDLGVTLAIELHFEFTTFELFRLFERLDAEPGGWLGVCLDTFNMLPMLEDPELGAGRILPWVVSTHVKDGAIALEGEGLRSFPTGVGEGLIDFPAILNLLLSAGRSVNLSVEDHGGSFMTDISDEEFLARFPDRAPQELGRLMEMARKGKKDLEEGRLAVTDREDWPAICQRRTQMGIGSLRSIVGGIRGDGGGAP
ncbi:MAG: TIM barrel protein [Gemmatimonadota bacterium]|jgi:sugar phosphate isomerase/epimerase